MSLFYRILVCGGRDYDDKEKLYKVLNAFKSIKQSEDRPVMIIHGAAKGADSLAGQWADDNGVEQLVFPADWKKYPKAAGPIRNAQMLKEGLPDIVIAFKGGIGTKDMIRKAKAGNVKVIKIL